MSPESLNQRLNPTAVTFLRDVFTALLTPKICATQSLASYMLFIFNRIRILDTKIFQLPDAFTIDYQGSGGCSHIADPIESRFIEWSILKRSARDWEKT